jgi:phage/plasmid primase-like uncharacterized protein
MVGALRNVGGAFVGIHRTFLAALGVKANLDPVKAALGPVAGAAIALAPVAEMIALGEGIETMLSVQQATGIPSFVATSASNLPNVELPGLVDLVIICADADDAGETAAIRAAQRFTREGRKVRIARPGRNHSDFNDMRL